MNNLQARAFVIELAELEKLGRTGSIRRVWARHAPAIVAGTGAVLGGVSGALHTDNETPNPTVAQRVRNAALSGVVVGSLAGLSVHGIRRLKRAMAYAPNAQLRAARAVRENKLSPSLERMIDDFDLAQAKKRALAKTATEQVQPQRRGTNSEEFKQFLKNTGYIALGTGVGVGGMTLLRPVAEKYLPRVPKNILTPAVALTTTAAGVGAAELLRRLAERKRQTLDEAYERGERMRRGE